MTPRIEHITENGIEKKRCGKCQSFKSLDTYNASSSSWDKLRSTCKDCLRQDRAENKDKMTEYNKQYWEKTKDKQKEKSKKWRENNKEHVKEKMKKWLEENKEYKKQKDNEYRIANWDKKKVYNREWRRKQYNELKTNPDKKDEFITKKIKSNIGRRIREILLQSKSKRSIDYVGCSLEDLKKHLESKFEEGMSWDNYGKYKMGNDKSGWHIDHIIPCNSFNFQDPFETTACFYYKNLQPLWGKDNIQKSDTYNKDDKERYLEEYRQLTQNVNSSS